MTLSEDRISHLSHEIMERLWRDDLADITDEARALGRIKQSLTDFFGVAEEVEAAVRAKLRNKAPGSRDWELLYQKFYQEEMARRKM